MTFKQDYFNTFFTFYSNNETDNEKLFETQKSFDKKILRFLFPDSYRLISLGNPVINASCDFEKTLEIALLFCIKYADKLKKYINYKETYENMIISGSLGEAKEVLNSIIDEFGVSLWTAGQLMFIAENEIGLEGNKKIFSSFLNETRKSIIVSTVLDFMSIKAELNTSYNNYNEKVERFLKNFKFENIVFRYFASKLRIQESSFCEDDRFILQIDLQSTIIDLYNSLIDVVQRAIVAKYEFTEKELKLLHSLYEQISDYRIRNILLFLGENITISLDDDVLDIIEQYTIHNYINADEKLSDYLVQNPSDFQLWLLKVKCSILNGEKQFKNNIAEDMYEMYCLEKSCVNARNKLVNTLKRMSDTSWRYKLLNLTSRKLSVFNNQDLIRLSLLNEKTITPKFLFLLPDNNIQYINLLWDQMNRKTPQTVAMFMSPDKVFCEDSITNEFREYLFYADYLYKNKEYEKALEYLDNVIDFSEKTNLYIIEKAIRKKYTILCDINNLEKAVELIVDSYFHNPYIIRRCNLSVIEERIKRTMDSRIFSSINYPLFIYLSDKFDEKNHRRALSNYIDNNNIQSVEMLIASAATNNKKQIFFLKNICTLNVLKREFRIAKTASAAASARLLILHTLVRIDHESANEYLEEISSITTRREINNRIRQVSKRKVFADVAKIKKEKQEIFEENFQKYLLMKKFNGTVEGLDILDSSTIDALRKVVMNMSEEIKHNVQYSQAILALKDLLSDITYEFLRNENYGLDTFLSSRIRHGYCKSQLTKEFKEHHLMLATSDDNEPEYNVSQYWDSKICEYQICDYEKMKEYLSLFTNKIESKILEIRNEWIRIKLTPNEVGMIDFSDFVNKALIIDKENIIDFDFLFNAIISSLWELTNRYLIIIRERIENELKSFFYDQLNDLEKNIRTLEKTSISTMINEATSNINLCRAKISSIITDFSSFFYKDDVTYQDYLLEDLYTTCMGIENQIHADFEKIHVQKRVYGEYRLNGDSFSYFVEIVVMLLNNAVTHAGFSKMEDINLAVSIFIDKNSYESKEITNALADKTQNWNIETLLVIKVDNNLSESKGKKYKKIEEKVQYIFENAKNPQVIKKYSTAEGGAGLYKIYKMIKYNMEVPYVILYNVTETTFSLTLAIDAEKLLVKGDVNNEDIIY